MRVYCGFCGAPNTARARFCRTCRRLFALPGGATGGRGDQPPVAERGMRDAWPAEWVAGRAPAPFVPSRPEQALGWPASSPAARRELLWPPPDAPDPLPQPPSPRPAPPNILVPPSPALLPGRVEYLIDARTGFPYDPHYQALVPTARNEPIAAFFPRLGALLVDYCILSVLWFCLVGAAALVDSAALGLIATFLGPALYFILFWSTGGRTPGYRAAGLQLLRTDGSRVGLRAGVIRYLGTLLGLPFFFLGYLWMLWDPAGQTWHDKLADTVVTQS